MVVQMIEKNEISNLPVPSVGGLSVYLAQIKKFPMLDAEEEYMLAKNWKENGNLKAAHKLVTSHLRLVAKIAMGYRGYGLPVNELISEGGVGVNEGVGESGWIVEKDKPEYDEIFNRLEISGGKVTGE